VLLAARRAAQRQSGGAAHDLDGLGQLLSGSPAGGGGEEKRAQALGQASVRMEPVGEVVAVVAIEGEVGYAHHAGHLA